MNDVADHLWARAVEALRTARHALSLSPDGAASRAFYAAFHAASAHFAMDNRHFKRHSATEAAVHRDLVHAGLLSEKAGEHYSRLARMRNTADYGGPQHVGRSDAEAAVEAAADFLRQIAALHPEAFKLTDAD